MRPSVYPFSAIVGQEQMKLALLLAAVDWRLGVLLCGEKGAGKTTTARSLAALLPAPAPFINLPIGATEDRLLGGLHFERALQGEAMLKPGLLSEAHRGVLYVDEINLLPAHLGDALLDTAASGVNVIEREGLSVSHAAEFVLLGSMNPEEGLLRPQLLDRFALSVEITASLDPAERQVVVERRMAFDRDSALFAEQWAGGQATLRDQVAAARDCLRSVVCPGEILGFISTTVCARGVRSLRADLAMMRASAAYAALLGEPAVAIHHVETVLPLVLGHRVREKPFSSPSSPPPPPPPTPAEGAAQGAMERTFAPKEMAAPRVKVAFDQPMSRGASALGPAVTVGPVVGSRLADNPSEIDLRATLNHAVLHTGAVQLRVSDLHERIRKPVSGTRYLFVIDSSGSHAAQERMRTVKGAVTGLLARTFKNDDDVVLIVFRGTSARVVLEPTRILEEVATALEYLPTGGRTPLAHALDLARSYVTPSTLMVLLTDGRANVAAGSGDPWQEAMQLASELHCASLVIDTESPSQALGQSLELARAMGARCVSIENLAESDELVIALTQMARTQG
jgi:magnesium chelatase subunit D